MRRKWGRYMVGVMGVLAAGICFEVALAGHLLPIARLGKIMYQDKDFSFNSMQSCMTCHHHMAGFVDPDNTRDPYLSVVSVGADGVSKGGRNAPTSAYAGYSPALHWDETINGYLGGMFWDGRATGLRLNDPLAEQAQGPPLNPAEMAMPGKEAVVQVVREAAYADLFQRIFGSNALEDVDSAYDNIARAIAAYERSGEVQKFSSRFDRGVLTAKEQNGFILFAAHCSQCHVSAVGLNAEPPLFTNYAYENLGLPANPLLTGNPTDWGLGGFLESDYTSAAPLIGDSAYAQQYGKFKVPTLRNVGMTTPYGHNGYFPTLEAIVDFHNTRDVADWPAPEVPQNLNTTDVGSMGLTENEVDDIVAFLLTLSDARSMGP